MGSLAGDCEEQSASSPLGQKGFWAVAGRARVQGSAGPTGVGVSTPEPYGYLWGLNNVSCEPVGLTRVTNLAMAEVFPDRVLSLDT